MAWAWVDMTRVGRGRGDVCQNMRTSGSSSAARPHVCKAHSAPPRYGTHPSCGPGGRQDFLPEKESESTDRLTYPDRQAHTMSGLILTDGQTDRLTYPDRHTVREGLILKYRQVYMS